MNKTPLFVSGLLASAVLLGAVVVQAETSPVAQVSSPEVDVKVNSACACSYA